MLWASFWLQFNGKNHEHGCINVQAISRVYFSEQNPEQLLNTHKRNIILNSEYNGIGIGNLAQYILLNRGFDNILNPKINKRRKHYVLRMQQRAAE